ncbi:MAG: hypothetical protein ACKV2V_11055 [Blastocatellia bacterium]
MTRRLVCLLPMLVFCLAVNLRGFSQSRPNPAPGEKGEEQNETFLDTLQKMKIKREEEAHKKLLKTAVEVRDEAETLLKGLSGEGEAAALPKDADKRLKVIEKGARKIRTESGGGNGEKQITTPPATLGESVSQLSEVSRRLASGMEKTSRHVVSAGVISRASEIIELVQIIRGYMK